MLVPKFISKSIPLATIFIFGLVAAGPNAALAKKVKGKGTVEILTASEKEKDEPAKEKASTPADIGPGGLTAKCKEKFEEFEDWDETFKAFALGVSEDRMECAFSEGDSGAIDSCNEELKRAGIYNTHCMLYAKARGGKVVILRKIDTDHTKSKKSAPKADAEITAEVKKRALEKAKLSAWNSYVKRAFSDSRKRTYRDLKRKMIEQLDEFFINLVPLDSWADKDAGTYTVMIRVEIDDGAVDAYFRDHSVAATQGSDEGSTFVAIFVARRATSMKSYNKRTTKIRAAEGTQNTKETAAAKGGTVVSGTTTKSMSRKDTGGSSVLKASKTEYEIISAQNVDTKINEVLGESYEIVSYVDLAGECGGPTPELINKAFITGSRMPTRLRKKVIRSAKECEVDYLAVGTLDVGIPDIDPSRGNTVVHTRVTGQVWSLARRLPRKVASVGPVQIKGWGDNDVVAGTNSLLESAKQAAKIIEDKMNQKGLR